MQLFGDGSLEECVDNFSWPEVSAPRFVNGGGVEGCEHSVVATDDGEGDADRATGARA